MKYFIAVPLTAMTLNNKGFSCFLLGLGWCFQRPSLGCASSYRNQWDFASDLRWASTRAVLLPPN